MNETYKNYFSPKTAAERYAKGRPRSPFFNNEKEKFVFLNPIRVLQRNY